MNMTWGRAAVLLSVGMTLTGCSHTIDAAKQDAAADSQKVDAAAQTAAIKTDQAVQKAGEAVKDVPKDVDSATVVTPSVKAAILQDPVLRNSRNLINVDSHDAVVYLKGHVMTEAMKQRATDDAKSQLVGNHSHYTVNNELQVQAGP